MIFVNAANANKGYSMGHAAQFVTLNIPIGSAEPRSSNPDSPSMRSPAEVAHAVSCGGEGASGTGSYVAAPASVNDGGESDGAADEKADSSGK